MERERTDRRQVVKQYIAFLRPYRYSLLWVVALSLAQFAVPLAGPWMTKIMLDEVLVGIQGFWTVKKVVLFLGIVFFSGVAFSYIRNIANARLGTRIVTDLRRRLYRHMLQLSQRFYDSRQVGGIVSRVLQDVNGAQNLVSGGVINLVMELLLVVFAVAMLFRLDAGLALLSLWLLPLYYLTFANLNVRIRFAWRSVHGQMERISGVLVERISGIRIVQSFNREHAELERFDRQADRHFDYSMSAHVLSNALGSISQSFTHIGSLIVWFYGGYTVLNGEMTVGSLIAFQMYSAQLYGPIQRFAQVNVTIQNSLANIERIFEIFGVAPEIRNPPNPAPLPDCKGEVVFKRVSFTYVTERPERKASINPDNPDVAERVRPFKKFYWIPPKTKIDPPPTVEEKRVALTDINFHARPGEVIALVGPSGAGKSTLINLIPRFYDPDQGKVLVDGRSVKRYDVYELRSHIAVVLQDNILFSGTVRDNIAYGIDDATDAQIVTAAKMAHVHEFVMEWEEAYGTVLGERGVRLSGGQKQRIAIARALLKNPRILILDEATSALDAESEALVTAALETLMKDRTTFVIAHRLATVVRADQILVMDHGKIVEQGSHAELLRRNGLYRELYEKQLKAMKPEQFVIGG